MGNQKRRIEELMALDFSEGKLGDIKNFMEKLVPEPKGVRDGIISMMPKEKLREWVFMALDSAMTEELRKEINSLSGQELEIFVIDKVDIIADTRASYLYGEQTDEKPVGISSIQTNRKENKNANNIQ